MPFNKSKIWYLINKLINFYLQKRSSIFGGQLLLGCSNMLLQNRILQMKSNQTLNMTLYLVLTDFDIFESIMRSNRSSDMFFTVPLQFQGVSVKIERATAK